MPRWIGRGLAAILSVTPQEAMDELRDLPVELVAPNPNQPRRAFDEEGLLVLVEVCLMECQWPGWPVCIAIHPSLCMRDQARRFRDVDGNTY